MAPGSLGALLIGARAPGSVAALVDGVCDGGVCEVDDVVEEDVGGDAAGRIGTPCAGVFALTAEPGVTVGRAGACDVLVGFGLSLGSDGRAVLDDDVLDGDVLGGVNAVRPLLLGGIARGTGADASPRTGVGAADGGLLTGAALGVGALGAGGVGAGGVGAGGVGATTGAVTGAACGGAAGA